MTTYYAIDPHDPNDKVYLDATNRKEAEKEMEQMQGFQLKAKLPEKKNSHVLDIAFEVESYYTSDDIPIEEIRHALLKRICNLDAQLLKGDTIEWYEAVDVVDSDEE